VAGCAVDLSEVSTSPRLSVAVLKNCTQLERIRSILSRSAELGVAFFAISRMKAWRNS